MNQRQSGLELTTVKMTPPTLSCAVITWQLLGKFRTTKLCTRLMINEHIYLLLRHIQCHFQYQPWNL